MVWIHAGHRSFQKPAGNALSAFLILVSETRSLMRQWQPHAQEIRPLFDRQREAAADELHEFAIRLLLQRLQLAAMGWLSRFLFLDWRRFFHEESFRGQEEPRHPAHARRIACCGSYLPRRLAKPPHCRFEFSMPAIGGLQMNGLRDTRTLPLTGRAAKPGILSYFKRLGGDQGAVANGFAVSRVLISDGIQVHGSTPFSVKTAAPITPTLRVSPWRRFA